MTLENRATGMYKLLGRRNSIWLAGALACNLLHAAQDESAQETRAVGMDNAVQLADAGRMNESQRLYYLRNWGVEVLGVRRIASGYMLEFRYRIADPLRARQLNDMKRKAYVIDEASDTRLSARELENAGTGEEHEEGRAYFIIFGNPELLVKSGSRVGVVIGGFRVDGLIVN